MKPILSLGLVAVIALFLSGCGFHLRRSARLPAGMQRVHLAVSGSSAFRRALARAVEASGSTVVDHAGPGIAELQVPAARFGTHALTITGQGRINEFAVRFHVRFDVVDGHGNTLVPSQKINMTREFTYSARHAIGRQTQVEAIRKSMVQNMVRSVMFRLQAAAVQPAPATSAPAPASATSTASAS